MNFERLGGGSGEMVGVNSRLKEEDKKEADGGSGGFWDKQSLPVDRGKVLHNTVIETEGGIILGVGGRACLLNDALLMHSH